jgi:hypothetical protein
MAIEGTCSVCGGTTLDYGCLNCVTAERDRLKEEVAELERKILQKPDFTPPIPGEQIEKFQRLWEACIGLAEKADFKAIFSYAHKIELEAHEVREIVLRHKDWLVAMAGLDNSPESPTTLRRGLFNLIEIAERKR